MMPSVTSKYVGLWVKTATRWFLSVARLGCLLIQVKACSRETHSPSWASEIYAHKAFK